MSKESRARGRRHRRASSRAATPAVTIGTQHLRPAKRVGTMALWIMTPFGVLMPALRPLHTYNPAEDARDIQVRGRERAYLDRFREMYCPELGESVHFPTQDYPWKAYVTRDDLARAVARMVLDIDSEVFKPLTDRKRGVGDSRLAGRLHSFYNSVWSTHLRFGDGTSSYDGGWKWNSSSSTAKGGVPKASSASTGTTQFWEGTGSRNPERCKSQGHWFSTIKPDCLDCGAPKPETWRQGDDPVYPQSPLGSWGEDGRAEWSAEDWEQYLKDFEDTTSAEELDQCPVCGRPPGNHKVNCELRDVDVIAEL